MNGELPTGTETPGWPHAPEPARPVISPHLRWNPYEQDPYHPDPYAPR